MAKKHNPAFLSLVEDAKTRIRETTVEAVKAKQDAGEPLHLLDVREESEFAAGHAAGAVHLGKGILERDIETLIPKAAEAIVLYCGGGFRSALAADSLLRMGYTNVASLAGGMRAWRAAGYPET